jgi:hypothetical protein
MTIGQYIEQSVKDINKMGNGFLGEFIASEIFKQVCGVKTSALTTIDGIPASILYKQNRNKLTKSS